MEFVTEGAGRSIRIIALVSLALGLNDAARLLGVAGGTTSPIETLGVAGFVLLGVFAAARLFAAVGLWIKASWGAVLLIGATGAELLLYLVGSPDVRMTVLGFALRLALLVAIGVVVVLGFRVRRARALD